jgi:hypothetical protein
MHNPSKNTQYAVIGIILLAALSRLLPHLPNFTPVGAMALFGGAFLANRVRALAAVFAAMLISDLFLGFHATAWAVYLSLGMIVLLGSQFIGGLRSGVAICVLASLLFFLVTNFAVWLGGGLYPLTLEGLILCYVAAIPFFWNTLAGDLCYFGLMCAAYYLSFAGRTKSIESVA